MAGRILQEDIEALRRRANLADLAADHTRLSRGGKNFKGLCPFHQERTPSFTVDATGTFFHCFGCQEGGDVYTFLQKVEGLSFAEAVEQLARRLGYPLRYEGLTAGQRRALGERSRLVAVTTAAADFFRRQLHSAPGEGARAYLRERGFGPDDADRFQLGFAPLAWESLVRDLQAQGFSPREIERAGVAAPNARGGLRDRFRGRLIFPVLDLSGEVIGFGGRVLPGLDYGAHEPPKYLNSPETPLYRKQQVLYGLSCARPEIVRTGEVLIGEGYTDVMALHRAGFTNAVATCGTAVGAEHLKLLRRYAERVILAFDADAAGETAAVRAFELAQEHDIELRVLVLPAGTDPADVVRQGGAEAMRHPVARAEPVMRFMLRRVTSGHDATPEGKAAAVDAAAPFLAQVADPVLRDQYTRWVADELVGVGLAVVAQAVQRAGGELHTIELRVSAPDSRGDRRERSSRAKLEREVLRIALQRPDLLPDRWREVTADDFSHPKARAVLAALAAGGVQPGRRVELTAVLDAATDDEIRALLRAIALEDSTVEPDPPHVAMLVSRLLLYRLEREIAARKTELERLNPTVEPDDFRRRFEQLITLEARRRDLREVVEA